MDTGQDGTLEDTYLSGGGRDSKAGRWRRQSEGRGRGSQGAAEGGQKDSMPLSRALVRVWGPFLLYFSHSPYP